jgi:hypothetical protein
MSSFTLRPINATMQGIYQRGRLVGRVVPHAAGGFVGVIKNDNRRGDTVDAAFREVCAAAFGFASADALRAHNRQARGRKRVLNARARAAFDAMLDGDYSALTDLLKQ